MLAGTLTLGLSTFEASSLAFLTVTGDPVALSGPKHTGKCMRGEL